MSIQSPTELVNTLNHYADLFRYQTESYDKAFLCKFLDAFQTIEDAKNLSFTPEENIKLLENIKKITNIFRKYVVDKQNFQHRIIYECCVRRQFSVINLIPSLIRDVNFASKATQDTALHFLAKKGDDIAIQWMIENGADLNVQNQHGETPLHLASQEGYLSIVKKLIENEASNIDTNSGDHIFHYSVHKNGNGPLVRWILEQQIDVDTRNNNNETALHMAVLHGSLDLIDILINSDADINASNNTGNTPLHYAAQKGDYRLLQKLLAKGAISLPNGTNQTPLDIARSCGLRDNEQILSRVKDDNPETN